jgi:membrane protein DedA with SNARE-associated domain
VTLDGFLMAFGGALILPLSVVEGPAVSAATGFLSSQGYFDWKPAILLLVCGDLIGDLICYWIGRSGARLGIRSAVSPALQRQLRQHSTKMLLVGKWTHAIGCGVLVASGMLRLPLPHFLLVNLIATVPKSALLFCAGYYAGDKLPLFERHALVATAVLAAAGVASIALILRQAQITKARP